MLIWTKMINEYSGERLPPPRQFPYRQPFPRWAWTRQTWDPASRWKCRAGGGSTWSSPWSWGLTSCSWWLWPTANDFRQLLVLLCEWLQGVCSSAFDFACLPVKFSSAFVVLFSALPIWLSRRPGVYAIYTNYYLPINQTMEGHIKLWRDRANGERMIQTCEVAYPFCSIVDWVTLPRVPYLMN